MTPLRNVLEDYLRLRRQLGYQLKLDGQLLGDFVGFLERAGATRMMTELALEWATLPVDARPHRWRQRLGIVRGFARYVVAIDPSSEVPSSDLLPARPVRVAPHVYCEAETVALMSAARALSPPLRAATFQTLIGLLAVTGVRLGEALSLDRHDVDLKSGTLHVHAKAGKQREVPVHDSTTAALGKYARLRDRQCPKPSTPAFFVSTRGRRLTAPEVHYTFPRLIRQVGIEGRGPRVTPRPHDFRHAYAVRTLLDWHHAGLEVDRKLPLLSTYLGHRDPADTQWYLQAVPELLALVAERLDGIQGEQP
ncbi:MAG: tyrosine-type recombinase/integrase [Solirubrobacteraceae bacterium]